MSSVKLKGEKLKDRSSNKEAGFKQIVYKRVRTAKAPTKTFHQNAEYDFLQYVRVVFKWATANYEITRPHLELLLSIYPIGIFKKSDFTAYCRVVDMNEANVFQKFVDDGWITIWEKGRGREASYYCLSNRAKILCGKLHKMCLGESKISEKRDNNKLMRSDKQVDDYYMDLIRKMNSRDINKAVDVKK